MWVENNTCVLTGNAILIWDGLTKPDVKDDGSGSKTWNVSVAVPANAPELVELEALRQKTLREKSKPSVNVNTPGNNPISDIDKAKFPELPGYKVFKATTTLGMPTVVDINGAEMSPMTFGPQLYNGLVIRLIVDAYTYDNKQKGVNFGLQSIQIVDATAPRLAIGASGMSAAAASAAFMNAAPAANTPTPAPGAASTDFPPVGWAAHPTAPGYFFKGPEVLTEAELRAKFPVAPPVAAQPPAPPAPPSPPAAPPAPHTSYMEPPAPPAPPAAFPPVGWWPHPGVPGSFYNAQNEVLTEAQLRARG